MGLFDSFKKKPSATPSTPSTQTPQNMNFAKTTEPINTLNLTKAEAVQMLNLRKETAGLILVKNNLGNIVARVAVVMDMSGSMRGEFKDGTVQSIFDRVLPIAMQFDDNGELDVWLFANRAKRLRSITEEEFYQYVDREIMGKRENQIWGGTEFAPVMRDVIQKYVHEDPSHLPTLVIFVTDGENSDHRATEAVIRDASKHNIFWQFVGIGNERFQFLKKLDDLQGRVLDNADFFQVNQIHRMSDEELYQLLVTEFPSWIQQARQKGMIR